MERIHRAQQHRSNTDGVQAASLVSSLPFPRHSHEEFGIGVILSGAHRSWSGVGPVEATQGDVIMVNPGEMHDGASRDGKVRRWAMLYFDPELVRREVAEEAGSIGEIVRPAVRDPLLFELLVGLFAQVTDATSDALAVEEHLLRTFLRALRRHGTNGQRPEPAPACVAKAIRRLDAAPELPASLAELASLSGVSRFQLLRSFSRTMGITPHAYLIQKRVQMARRLLARGVSPSQAALDAGFADQSHLTRAFVRQFGVSPARYRAALA